MQRVTLKTPLSLRDAAGYAAWFMGKAQNAGSYATLAVQTDGDGNSYVISSGLWTEAQIAGGSAPAILQARAASGITPRAAIWRWCRRRRRSSSLPVPKQTGRSEPWRWIWVTTGSPLSSDRGKRRLRRPATRQITVSSGPGENGAPDRIRTYGLCLRRAALYPAELQVPADAV